MHALKAGQELMKRTGHPGPVRTVKRVEPRGGVIMAKLEWPMRTRRDGDVMVYKWLEVEKTGLPAGYVLAKDRAAKRGGK